VDVARDEHSGVSGFVWKVPARLRIDAAIVVLAVAAIAAAFAVAAVRFSKPPPTRFDHATWIKHPNLRRFMLNDLLTSRICLGTPAARVVTLLGKPDYTMPGFAEPATYVYEVGTPDPLSIDFWVTRHSKVVFSVLPPFWPPTGCWS
jgi:hypothetical protein